MKKTLKIVLGLLIAVCLFAGVTACDTPTNDDSGSKTVAATGIVLNKDTITLEEGKSETLTVTFMPENTTDKTVTWTTDDAESATVANGVVTAAADGAGTTCVITATTANGKTATCDVTVTAGRGTEFKKESVVADGKTNKINMTTGKVIELEGYAVSGTTVLALDEKFVGTFSVKNNKLIVSGQVKCMGFTFNLGSKIVKNNDESLTISYSVNNSTSIFNLGSYTFTKAEANSLGFDVDAFVIIPVTSITWDNKYITATEGEGGAVTYTMNLVSGKQIDLMEIATFSPANTTTTEFTSVSPSDGTVTKVSVSVITGCQAGSSDVTVKIDDLTYVIKVNVTYPENMYKDAVKFGKTVNFATVTSILTYNIPGNIVFFADGMVTDKTNMGYYTLVKSGETITQIKYTLFSDNTEVVLDITEKEGLMTSTVSGESASTTYTEVAYNGTFGKETTFNFPNPLDPTKTAITLTFNTDGTFSGTYAVYFPMTGYYNYKDGKIELFFDNLSFLGWSGTYDVTETEGVKSFTLIYFPGTEVVAEA